MAGQGQRFEGEHVAIRCPHSKLEVVPERRQRQAAERQVARSATLSTHKGAMGLAAEYIFAESVVAGKLTPCGSTSKSSRSRVSPTITRRRTDKTARRFACFIFSQGAHAKATFMTPSINFAHSLAGAWSSKNSTFCAGQNLTLVLHLFGQTFSLKSRLGHGMFSFYHHLVALSGVQGFTMQASLAPGRFAQELTCADFRGSAILTRTLLSLPTISWIKVSSWPNFSAQLAVSFSWNIQNN